MVRRIEPRPLEDYPRRRKYPFERPSAFFALCQRLVMDALVLFNNILAMITFVFVYGHSLNYLKYQKSEGRYEADEPAGKNGVHFIAIYDRFLRISVLGHTQQAQDAVVEI